LNIDRYDKTSQNQAQIKRGLRESKNTKNYTGSLFLKSYIQFLCQQAKKITREPNVSSRYNTIHLHLARNPLHLAEKHLGTLKRIQNQ